jgi:hypothetical protein
MKVGIITFHRALNYGAVLQTYALQQILDEMGIESDVIDYECKTINDNYNGIIFSKCNRKKEYLNAVGYFVKTKNKRNNFDKFISESLQLSSKCNRQNIGSIETEYDCFITGSDQVFNDKCTGFDTTYFLDFVKNPLMRNSYAASFGFQQVPDALKGKYTELLNSFNNISVREEQGIKIVKELTGKKAVKNVDPTLALNSKQWEKKIKNNFRNDKYIFVYTVMDPVNLVQYAVELSHKTGFKVVYLHGNIETYSTSNSNGVVENIYSASPDDFLNYIYHAEYIITNSFHGTVFSIIYKKKFIVELEAWKYNKRAEELLKSLNINGHVLSDINLDTIDDNCDWDEIEKLLEVERLKTKDYLHCLRGVK